MNINTKKFYDVLIGEGKGGGNAYTAILSNNQKHQLAMLNTAQQTRDALKKLCTEAEQCDVYYVQCEEDIKIYISKKGLFWSRIAHISVLLTMIPLVLFINQSSVKLTLILVLCIIAIIIAIKKMNIYIKQRNIMLNL